MSKKIVFIAFVVSLGGFLFGFDAGIISGVMSYAGPEFNLSDGMHPNDQGTIIIGNTLKKAILKNL